MGRGNPKLYEPKSGHKVPYAPMPLFEYEALRRGIASSDSIGKKKEDKLREGIKLNLKEGVSLLSEG